MVKKDIILEEAVLDDLSEGLEIIEKPIERSVFKVFIWLVLFVILVVFARLTYLQIIKNKNYQLRALANVGQQVVLKSPRGIIYDRYSQPLVSNQPSFSLSLNLSELLKNPNLVSSVLQKISEVVPFDIEAAKNSILSVNLEKQAYFTLLPNITLQQVIEIKKLNLKSVIIENNYTRQYVDGPIFAHLLGYTGLVTAKDIAQDPNFELNDEIGKVGLEASYDKQLRGKNGLAIKYQDAKGNLIDTKVVSEPIGGNSLYTTIDADLQRYFFEVFKDQLTSLGRDSGAGLIMDPANGEILSLVSFPTFDNDNLTPSLFADKRKPTFNRVISGIYSPGSTIKPLVAFAALKEKIIDPFKKILSIGYIEIPNPYFPDKPSRFLDWRPHGWVDLRSALARSSNIYFYAVGGGFIDKSPGLIFGGVNQQGLGIGKLIEYWKKFLLDQKTGIDLVGESVGVLADPFIKEKNSNQPWRIGDTYNVSIGQGDLRITPIALLRYISVIFNKGKAPTPFIVKSIKDLKGNTIYQAKPNFVTVEEEDLEDFKVVEEGMIDGTKKSYGTSYLLSDIPMTIAAKTGSAQIQNNQKVNAFFVGYNLPEEKADLEGLNQKSSNSQNLSVPKQIAVLILIEDAKEGSLNAVPIAKKVFEWYYNNRIKKLENN